MELITSIEDELEHWQVVLAESASLVVSWTVDDIVAIDLLGSPILRDCFDGEVQRRLEEVGGRRREERVVEVCSREVR